ncbi:DUF4350 domain-containing protein [Inquilinus sp. KBS0705]|nr:DUF4350 domain-containing protein [Inquilinus sp. KBS0705]
MKRFGITIILATVYSFTANAQVVVTLDYYFNHEARKNTADQPERFHYLWEDKSNTGFSVFGDAFKNKGAVLSALDVAPTADKLKGTGIYIIVDPDTKKESPDPKYINQADVTEIAAWVKQGGVLLLMANDSANVELPHFNKLAAKFGMHFNNDMQNHVVDDMHFEDGAVVTTGNAVFASAQKIFMKDVCSITLSGNAKTALVNKAGATIIAIAKYGKGMVMAIGDPWLYNEYTNGRLPATFENDKAANDIAAYLIKQAK